jgi:hypothetical protein
MQDEEDIQWSCILFCPVLKSDCNAQLCLRKKCHNYCDMEGSYNKRSTKILERFEKSR